MDSETSGDGVIKIWMSNCMQGVRKQEEERMVPEFLTRERGWVMAVLPERRAGPERPWAGC